MSARREHEAARLADGRAVDLNPRHAQLEGFGVIDLVRDHDLDGGDGQVGGTEERNIHDVSCAKSPFLRGPEDLSRHLLRGHRLASVLTTAPTERDGSAAAPPVLHRLHEEPLRREVNDAFSAAGGPPVVKVASLHLARVKIHDRFARGTRVRAATGSLVRRHETSVFAHCRRYSETLARGHVYRAKVRAPEPRRERRIGAQNVPLRALGERSRRWSMEMGDTFDPDPDPDPDPVGRGRRSGATIRPARNATGSPTSDPRCARENTPQNAGRICSRGSFAARHVRCSATPYVPSGSPASA